MSEDNFRLLISQHNADEILQLRFKWNW